MSVLQMIWTLGGRALVNHLVSAKPHNHVDVCVLVTEFSRSPSPTLCVERNWALVEASTWCIRKVVVAVAAVKVRVEVIDVGSDE
jgi:hypothetical protein